MLNRENLDFEDFIIVCLTCRTIYYKNCALKFCRKYNLTMIIYTKAVLETNEGMSLSL